mgnify:FL=1
MEIFWDKVFMNKSLKMIGKMSLAAAMMFSAVVPGAVTISAQDTDWQLSDASIDRVEGNDVYLTYGSGQKARITFLNNEVF